MVDYVPQRHAGQALVELALSLMIFLVVILGLVATAQWLGAHQSVSSAARTAAAYAALTGGDAGPGHGARQAALDALDSGFGTSASGGTVTIRCAGKDDAAAGGCARYDPITVTVRYEADVWVPFPYFTHITVERSVTRLSEQEGQP